MTFMNFHILGIIHPTDLCFFQGVENTNQVNVEYGTGTSAQNSSTILPLKGNAAYALSIIQYWFVGDSLNCNRVVAFSH